MAADVFLEGFSAYVGEAATLCGGDLFEGCAGGRADAHGQARGVRLIAGHRRPTAAASKGTWKELASLTPMIGETPGLESAGIRPVAWGPDPASNSILIQVIGSVDAAGALFDEQLGSGWVTVESWVGELPRRL